MLSSALRWSSTRPARLLLALVVSLVGAGVLIPPWRGLLRAQASTIALWQFENIAQPTPGLRVPLAGFEFDRDGRPVVAWREENGSGLPTRVFWTRKEGGVWNANEFLSERRYDGGGKDGVAHRMILRPSDGHPFLVYRDVAPGNYLNTYRTDLGAHPTGGVSDYLEGLVGPQNCAGVDYALAFAPVATFPDWATGLALCTGFGPVRLDGQPLTANAVEGAHTGLTVTPDGTRHMLWSSGRNVYYTRWPTGDALPTTLATPLFNDISSLGGEVRMASDASGVIYAAIRGVEGLQGDFDLGAVVYIESRDGGQTWTPFQFVDPVDDAVPNSNGANSDISLAVDAAGIPAVTYWRSRQELWYARRDGPGGTWTRSLVTTMAYTGQPYSAQLRFDANNGPVIAYYDHNVNRLRLARPVPSGVTPAIDVAVTGTAAPSTSQPGAPLTFTLTVTNRGTTNVDHVVLSNMLPTGVTFVDASPRPDAGGQWPIGLLTSGASATVTVSATAPAVPGDVVNVVSVTSDGTDADPGNNAAAIGMTVRPVACLNPALAPTLPSCGVGATSGLDVAVSVTSMPNPVVVNGLFTFVVKATNVGTVDAVGVTVTNTLPPGLTLRDGAPAPPGDVGDEQVYTLESLPVGTSAWFVIRTIAPFVDTVVDRARVSVAGDVNAANDTASTSTVVEPDACFVAPAGLVSRWRGDGNALDSVGTHHGQQQGTAAFAQGRQGQAFSFDGVSQSLVMADSPELRPVQFTVSAWVYPESLRHGYDVVFSAGHSLWLGFSNRTLLLYTHEFGESVQMSSQVSPNQWHLLTASYDGVSQRLYLDGVKVAERVVNTPMTYGPPEVAGIGGYWYYGQLQAYENFHGLIDEVTLHNRALGDAEVRGLYDGSSPSCPPPNHPPAITSPGDQSSAEGTTVSLPIAVQDGDGDALTYSATGLPPGLALTPTSSGVDVAGALGFVSAGPYDVTLTVGDGTTTRTSRFLWTVTNVACTPLAFPDSAATPMNTPIEIHVIDNDPLPSACRQFGVPVFSDVTQPAHGSVVLDGKFSTAFYTPAPSFTGVDTFTYSIANSEGSATATVTVVVSSPLPPTVVVPADMLVEATAPSGATVTFVASAVDGTGTPLTPLCLPPSGTVFAIGTTVVTCAASDALGLTSQNAFSITVRDSTGPTLSIPDPVTTEQTGAGGAVVTFIVSAVDSVDNTTTAADCLPASGSTFPLGTTAVTCSATDSRGNTSTETFDVTVTPAVLQCLPPPQGLASWWPGNDSAADVVGGRSGVPRGGVTYGPGVNRSAFAFDGSSGYVEVPTANDNDLYPQSGAFTLSAWVKTTSLDTMAVVAKDECANGCASTSTSRYVLLLDQGYPMLVLENANGDNYLLNAWPGVRGIRSVADGAFHHIMVVRDVASTPVVGFPDLGEVRLYIDGEYAQFLPSFMTGSLQDDNGVGDPLTIGAWKFRGQTANYFNGAIDDVMFYRRALTAAEAFGMFTQRSTGQCHGTDNRAPVLETPLDQSSIEGETIAPVALSATDPDGDALGYSTTVLPFGLSIDVPSGTIGGTLTAVPGQYSVTATVSDGSLSDSKTFLWTITARDTEPPVITVPSDMSIDATGPTGAPVAFTASATDLVDGPTVVDCTPASGSLFPIGTTTVVCSSSDAHGNSATESFAVTVLRLQTTTTIGVLPSPPVVGQAVAFTAVLAAVLPGAGVPTGVVTFREGATVLATASVSGGSASLTLSGLALGGHDISADYSGDAVFQPSQAVVTFTVQLPPPAVIEIAERIIVEDSAALLPAAMLAIAERIVVQDSVTLLPAAMLEVVERVVVADSVAPTTTAPAVIEIAERIVVQDSATLLPAAMVDIVERVVVADTVVPTTTAPAVIEIAERIAVQDAAAPLPATLLDIVERVVVADTSVPTATPADANTGNTPSGTNVVVTPVDPTGSGTRVTLTFSTVTRLGSSSATISADGPPPPARFQLGNPPVYFDIATTALFSGPVTVCIDYTGMVFKIPRTLSLLHFENGVWVNRTVSADLLGHTICASVTSFSPFVVVEPINSAPVLTNPGDQVAGEGQAVALQVAASDADTDPLTFSATGLPPGLQISTAGFISGMPTDRSAGVYSVAVTVSDGALTATAAFRWTVVDRSGRMTGEGHVAGGNLQHHFAFTVTERRNGADFGRVEFWIRESDTPRRQGRELNRFDASTIAAVTFSDDPGFMPGRRVRPTVDTVAFSGSGRWNGRPGYSFEARATDQGEPGAGRDTLAITIRDSRGVVVATIDGALAAGNIQSARLSR